jgi:hypothetical protein
MAPARKVHCVAAPNESCPSALTGFEVDSAGASPVYRLRFAEMKGTAGLHRSRQILRVHRAKGRSILY